MSSFEAAEQGILIERNKSAALSEPIYRDYQKMFASLPRNKVQCYNSVIGGMPDVQEKGNLSPLPVYYGPTEGIAETPHLLKEYPLVFSDVHADRLCQHSYYVEVPLLREHAPYPWVRINPKTAQSYGISDGDWVDIQSPHGHIVLMARYFEAIAPDVLMARRGWWQGCVELELSGCSSFDGGSEVNVLYDSNPASFDRFHSAMSKQTLVRISKRDKPPVLLSAVVEGFSKHNISPAVDSKFDIDKDRCIGCLSCTVACKQWNGISAKDPSRRIVRETVIGQYPHVGRSFVSLACHHCEKPKCLEACAFDAIVKRKEDGAVLVLKDACSGCGACVTACPYEVPQLIDDVMDKCDCCMTSRVAPGFAPHCVLTCPTQALRYRR